MARSSIERLSPELRHRLQELLARPEVTQEQVAATLNAEAGETVVSKSAVNRYAVRMREIADRNRQAREIAEMYLRQVGPEGQNALGEVILHQVRALAFDFMMELRALDMGDPQSAPKVAALIGQVARATRDMESAATTSAERRRKIAAEATEQAAVEATAACKEAGLSQETVDAIKARILGVA